MAASDRQKQEYQKILQAPEASTTARHCQSPRSVRTRYTRLSAAHRCHRGVRLQRGRDRLGILFDKFDDFGHRSVTVRIAAGISQNRVAGSANWGSAGAANPSARHATCVRLHPASKIT